ncbi:DMT family transporter [Tranquillimonas alkanivorans]|uniref:Permease of the drug/metabolite transporter (DMT) superfamily n=1 Tax=Tranquillimonas alkanivorans TaxID=441119 RepID=A0A1I5P1V5_9RHOB|nr:DMT family transporter [Tranquillimonas alkanivorans]SFP27977.1 Permease of the drug/metabolite transporter (DMT) superfamily [Tranquillimonas alkanivorans]
MATLQVETHNAGKAALWMFGAIASFSSMAVAGREVSFELDTFEIMTYRSFVGILIVLIIGGATGHLREVNTQRLGIHLIRNISHFTGQNLWFYAITLIPLAQVFALEFSMPIWVAVVMAPLILGERLTAPRLATAAIGFCGILIVARPDFGNIEPGIVAAAGAAVGFAGSAVFTKLLTRTATITCILFWLTVMQAVFGIVCAGIDGDIALPSAATLPGLVVIGIAGLLAHFCLTTALTLAPAAVVMPFDFMRLPVIAVVGMIVYAEPVDALVIMGAAIIFGANYLNLWADRRDRRRAA